MNRILLAIFIMINFSGCATILSGKTQTLSIQTNPPGATCELTREGRIVGSVNPSPGAVSIDKTKHDISIVCKKPGYQDAVSYIESGTEGATFGNILAGGLIGWGIDSAAGADNKYADVTTITLLPVDSGASPVLPKEGEAEPPAQVAAAVPPTGGATGLSVEERLKKLEELKAKGLINEGEYERKKKEVLGEV